MNDNAKKWVEALRSGKYKQCTGRLAKTSKDGEEYCCLGVGCELFIKSGGSLKKRYIEDVLKDVSIAYNNRWSYLPEPVQVWLGLRTDAGGYGDGETLAHDQDSLKKTFPELANIIESEPEGLFV